MTSHEIRTWKLHLHKLLDHTNTYFAHRTFIWSLRCFFSNLCKVSLVYKIVSINQAFPGLMRWNKARVLAYFTSVHPPLLDHHWFFMTSARLPLPAALCLTHSSQLMPTQQSYTMLLVHVFSIDCFSGLYSQEKTMNILIHTCITALPTRKKIQRMKSYTFIVQKNRESNSRTASWQSSTLITATNKPDISTISNLICIGLHKHFS